MCADPPASAGCPCRRSAPLLRAARAQVSGVSGACRAGAQAAALHVALSDPECVLGGRSHENNARYRSFLKKHIQRSSQRGVAYCITQESTRCKSWCTAMLHFRHALCHATVGTPPDPPRAPPAQKPARIRRPDWLRRKHSLPGVRLVNRAASQHALACAVARLRMSRSQCTCIGPAGCDAKALFLAWRVKQAASQHARPRAPVARPTATDVICCVCRPATSLATRAERRSQKRSVPSKWPLTARLPSRLTRTLFTLEWHTSERWQKPRARSHTCATG